MTASDPHLIKVLLVEDNEDDFLITRELLADVRECRYEVDWAPTYEAAVSTIAAQQHDIYLLDYHLGAHNGLEVLQKAIQNGCNAPIILLTGTAPRQIDMEAMQLGATDFLCKDDISTELLERTLRYTLRQKQAEAVLRQQAERERLTTQIAQQIHQLLDLDEILHTTVTEVQQLFHADRVLVYRFEPDWSTTAIAEAVVHGWQPVLEMESTNHYFADAQRQRGYLEGGAHAIHDVRTVESDEDHLDVLQQLHVQAKLIVPILLNQAANYKLQSIKSPVAVQGARAEDHRHVARLSPPQDGSTLQSPALAPSPKNSPSSHATLPTPQLWGLLVVHQCDAPRQWQAVETTLLTQLASQVAIALQQSQLHQQLQAANQELQRLTSLDELTQIPNRQCFTTRLNWEWRRLVREQQYLSLILCDIDYFKRYNDVYGHVAGDECLRKIAQCLHHSSRRAADFTARCGGEAFAVILPNTNSAGAVNVVEGIREAIKHLNCSHALSPISDQVTLSFGIVSVIPSRQQSSATLIEQAEQALYQAKQKSRNTYHIHQDRGNYGGEASVR